MTDPRIGSREWRFDPDRVVGRIPAYYLAARCGLRAPGRSVDMNTDANGEVFWSVWGVAGGTEYYERRADAAQAAWKQEEPYRAWVTQSELYWKKRLRDFWQDAYRVMR